MPIRAVSFFTYRTKGGDWTAPQLGVLRFVQAIKQEPRLGSRQDVRVNGIFRSLGQANRHDAFKWFAEMAAAVLDNELKTTRVILVPIPDSTSALAVADCRTARLAQAIVQKTDAKMQDILRWDGPLKPAHKGGPRYADELYPHLRFLGNRFAQSSRPFVLIDDVTTGGGHIRACAAFLKEVLVNAQLAICGAKADQDPPADPFERRIDTLDDYVPPKA